MKMVVDADVFILFCFVSSAAASMPLEALQTPPSISGVVEDETGQPVTGVEVTLFIGPTAQWTSTNDLGRFRFEAVPDRRSPFEF